MILCKIARMTQLILPGMTNPISTHNGLYRLADVYRAAGSPKNLKKPYDWLRLKDTQDYIKEAEDVYTCRVLTSVKGLNDVRGIYAHKLIAIEYARYLDKRLAVLINHVFDQYMMGTLTSLQKTIESNNVIDHVDANAISNQYGIKLKEFHDSAVKLGYIVRCNDRYQSNHKDISSNKCGTLQYKRSIANEIIDSIGFVRVLFG